MLHGLTAASNRRALDCRTREFYERHGGKTIIIARFMPIIRTFAPLFCRGQAVAACATRVSLPRAWRCAWVGPLVMAGYWFGNPRDPEQCHPAIFGIILLLLRAFVGVAASRSLAGAG